MKAVEWFNVVLICLVISMGLIIRDLQPVVENPYVVFTNGVNTYRILKDSEILCEKIDVGWYFIFDSSNGRKIVECLDNDIATADEWKESILMGFDL